jgi:autotransporter adhesin
MSTKERMQKMFEEKPGIADNIKTASESAASAGEAARDKAIDIGQKLSKAAMLFGKKAGAAALDAAGAMAAAGDKARAGAVELGEKGKLAIEIKKLEAKTGELVKRLGYETYIAFVEEGIVELTAESGAIKPILAELRELSIALDEKEERLNTKAE